MAETETLHVVWLQEPLAWILQRLASSTTAKSGTPLSHHGPTQSHHFRHLLLETCDSKQFAKLGQEYLNFLEMNIFEDEYNLFYSAISCFERNIIDACIEGGIIQAQYSNKNKTLLKTEQQFIRTQSMTSEDNIGHHLRTLKIKDVKDKLHSSLSIATKLASILNRPNTIILIHEYVAESAEILNHVFATTHFHSDPYSPLFAHTSKTATAHVSAGSPLAVKNAAAQLELHQLLYQEALLHFFGQYYSMKNN